MLERKLTRDPGDEPNLIPEGKIGSFLPVTESDVEIFNTILSDEIDSAFSSTICCCDFCYDDFKKYWPEVTFREMEFQTNSMEVRWLIEYSRMRDIYSPDEIATLRYFAQCPRCGNRGTYNIWLYEHSFSNAPEIEAAVDELLTIGSSTPFLMLDHPFARQVLDQIRSLATTAVSRQRDTPIYRARLAADVTSDLFPANVAILR
jgi:hypothetical protein